MSSESITPDSSESQSREANSEQGLLLAILFMVILGVIAIFLPAITALAGLVTASAEYLGPHAGPVRDGLKTLQLAFRESSAAPDEPGQGPGEKYTGPVG